MTNTFLFVGITRSSRYIMQRIVAFSPSPRVISAAKHVHTSTILISLRIITIKIVIVKMIGYGRALR